MKKLRSKDCFAGIPTDYPGELHCLSMSCPKKRNKCNFGSDCYKVTKKRAGKAKR